jgi:hypothetical protein
MIEEQETRVRFGIILGVVIALLPYTLWLRRAPMCGPFSSTTGPSVQIMEALVE